MSHHAQVLVHVRSGFKFNPTDEELVQYLYNKLSGEPLPCGDAVIKECNLYGTDEPWEIWDMYGGAELEEDESLYFFTRLKKKSANDDRYVRKVGGGAWKGEQSARFVKLRKANKQLLVAAKKRFSYENSMSNQTGCWIMHEFSVANQSSIRNVAEANNFVLCRIKPKDPSSSKDVRKSVKKRKIIVIEDEEDEKPEFLNHHHHHHHHHHQRRLFKCTKTTSLKDENAIPAQLEQLPLASLPDIIPMTGRPKSAAQNSLPVKFANCGYKPAGEDQETSAANTKLTPMINTVGTSMSSYYDDDDDESGTGGDEGGCSDWGLCFAEELLKDQAPESVLIEKGIDMLPNQVFTEKWVDWEILTKSVTT